MLYLCWHKYTLLDTNKLENGKMQTKKHKDKLEEINPDDYQLVRISAKIPPALYKDVRKYMEEIGVRKESTIIQMALKLLVRK